MRRLHTLIVALAVFTSILSSRSVAGPADQAVSGIIEKWSAAFTKLDADALASLYSSNALFFGSSPPLYKGKRVSRPISMRCLGGNHLPSSSRIS